MVASDPIVSLLLDGLAPEDQSRLGALFTREAYPAGADVIRQGEPCESLYIVESGSVLIHTSQRGDLAHRGPGECLGEISMFTAGPASATVTAVTDVVLRAVPQAEMRPLLEELPLLARNFCRVLGRRLVASSQIAERSPLTLLVCTEQCVGVAFVLNLAASLAHHLQQEVAVVDLSDPAEGSGVRAAPVFEQPLERLTLVRSGGLAPDQLPPLVDTLTRQCGHVLAWAPEQAARRLEPLTALADRMLVAVAYEACHQTDYRPWSGQGITSTELLVFGAPEPRSPAVSDEIERVTNLPVAALLPAPPAALKTERGEPGGGTAARSGAGPRGWASVLRSPELPFARATARLARRLAGKSVGIAFGAGAARGYAHLGALRALERLGIYPDLVAGTSIGACVAALYAYGFPLHEIQLSMQRFGPLIRQRSFPIYSFLAGSGLDRACRAALPPHVRIEDLPLPCAFVATDLLTGEEVVLRRGSGWLSGRASMTIPGIFPPVRLDGRLLVDGGVVNPVPCRAVRAMGADIVLGISLEIAAADARRQMPAAGSSALLRPDQEQPAPARRSSVARRLRRGEDGPTWPGVLLRAFDLQQQSRTQQCLQAADVSLRAFTPPVSLTDFRGGPELLEAGERAVEAAEDRLRALLPWVGR
jgi:NTE family protein